jgi:ubiquitin-protein ligase E3 C
MLLIIGDDEFFNESVGLQLSEVFRFSSVVKLITFQMHWQVASLEIVNLGGTLIPFIYARDLFTKILAQLYDRDTRRLFCPKDHWLVEDSVMNTFIEMVPFQSDLDAAVGRVNTCKNILRCIPFIIPFEKRVELFRSYVRHDQGEYIMRLTFSDEGWHRPVAKVSIRRGRVFEDGYAQLNPLSIFAKYLIDRSSN